jgi:cytochrome o ubiquinol oxidase operon protein cyoD
MSDLHHTASDYGTGEKNLRVYIAGIIICIILTLLPFGVIMHATAMSQHAKFAIIFVSAILQFLTQVICFLRLNLSTPQGWMNVMSFAFAVVVLIVIIGGSLWIMYHLDYNMMH